MPTFNQGIRTNAGYDLFGKVQSGQTKIHYTKVVYSSLDLSNKTDDDIQNMTDVNPKELIIHDPQVLYKPRTNNSDQETEIRALGSNETLNKGFYINTYALYAADDKGNEILYGITADNNPSWLPAYDGIRPQALTYNWDTGDKDTNNVHFTDSHDAYATYGDLQDFTQVTNGELNKSLSTKGDLTVNDLNEATNVGIYNVSSYNGSLKNAPDIKDSKFWGTLTVLPGSDVTLQSLYVNHNGINEYFYRIKAGDPNHWGNWTKVAGTDSVTDLQNQIKDSFNQNGSRINNLRGQIIATNTNSLLMRNDNPKDFNDISNPGIYNVYSKNGSVKNAPNDVPSTFWGILIMMPGDAISVQSMYISSSESTHYYRISGGYPKEWGNWIKD